MTEHSVLDQATRRHAAPALTLPAAPVREILERAFAEDAPAGDITSQLLIPADARATAVLNARVPGVLSGATVFRDAMQLVDPGTSVELLAADGETFHAGTHLARVSGPARSVLLAERVALNLVQRMSAIATRTAEFVQLTQGTSARITDTRKTTPGLRVLERFAVRCGGGANHRMALSDAALVKDNHVLAAGGVAAAFAAVRDLEATIPVEIEVDSLAGLREAILAGADAVLLDNFELSEMRQAVALRAELGAGGVLLEASGGLTLEVATQVGRTGVDFVAVGELTHSARVLDLGLDLVEVS
jgi:nicotinate-nucleotide pyrophosphorylase (carboxylating)